MTSRRCSHSVSELGCAGFSLDRELGECGDAWSSAQLGAERRAAGAAPEVTARQRAGRASAARGVLAELEPDLLAGNVPGLGGLVQRAAGADQQRLDARHGRVHGRRDLLVG